MELSDVKICNLALRKLGARLIESLGDYSQEAVTCNLFFAQVRDAVLREHPWNFATKRIKLSRIAESPAFGFKYQFQLPSDCLHLRKLLGTDADFVVEGDRVLTNIDKAYAIYTVREINAAVFDPLFVMAFTARLAAEIADDITGSSSKVKEMWTLYLNAMQSARLADSLEGQEDFISKEPWLEARGLYGTDNGIWGK